MSSTLVLDMQIRRVAYGSPAASLGTSTKLPVTPVIAYEEATIAYEPRTIAYGDVPLRYIVAYTSIYRGMRSSG